MSGFPTSSDIYLEMNGKKVAVVQSYTAKATKSSKNVEAFGECEPIATIEGQKRYTLELTRLYATDDAVSDGINFHELSDFSLVICKPDRKVIYSGCEWSAIQEDGQLNAMVAEKVTVIVRREIDTLTPPTAGRLLSLWQEKKALEDPLERVLRCNGAILAECCFFQGKPVFDSEEDVLKELTTGEMEQLLCRLADAPSAGTSGEVRGMENPAFDWEKFQKLQGR